MKSLRTLMISGRFTQKTTDQKHLREKPMDAPSNMQGPKRLGEVLSVTPPTARAETSNSSSTPPHGLIKDAGKLNTVPAMPSQNQLEMTSLWLSRIASCQKEKVRGKLRYNYKQKTDEYVLESMGFETVMTSDEKQAALDILRPMNAPFDRSMIMALLTRLLAHKQFTDKQENLIQIFMEDVTSYLERHSHYAVAQGIESAKRDPSPWFPTLGKILEYVEAHEKDLNLRLDQASKAITLEEFKELEKKKYGT